MNELVFNRYGLQGDLPEDCIAECSHPGSCDAEVEYWREKLNLVALIEPSRAEAEEFLGDYGAWKDLATADIETLADRILWVAACDAREEQYEAQR